MWSAGSREGAPGFTLIELVVVLLIAGLIAAIALPVFSRSMEGLEFNRALNSSVSVMRYARDQAVYRRQPVWIAVDMEKDRYVIGEGTAEDEPYLDGEDTRSHVLPGGVVIEEFTWADGSPGSVTGWIRFYPDGSSSGGAFTLSGTGAETSATVYIEPFTGLARIRTGE